MYKFKLNVISAALVSGGMAFSSSFALAQEAADSQAEAGDEIEKIEVRGFATSLIQSLNQKRFGDTVSEQLSADDLGGLPDVSMADALTRLPGISAVRTGGQAAEINIRGLSGDFVFSTLNGREQVSTSGDRAIEFDQYPSELINSAAVYKSPKASLIEGGVAGTVELQTASPLSIDEQYKVSFNLRGMYSDRAGEIYGAEEYGDRFSVSYQGKFLDDTLGVALGFARLYQPSASTQFIGLAYNAVNNEVGNVSEGFEMQHLGGEETRNGYVAAIEWEPSDSFTLKADAFVSKFDSEEFARGFRVKLEGATANFTNPVYAANGDVIGATVSRSASSQTRIELVNDDNRDYDEVESYGINATWQLSDNFSMSLDASLSSAESDFRNGLLWSLVAEDANAETPVFDTDVQISYQLNGLDLPDLGFNQADAFSDINRVMASKYGIYPYENSDELEAYRVDFVYELESDFISSIEFGARYSDREYSNDRSVFEYGSDNTFNPTEPPLRLTEDMATVVDWEGEFSYFPSYLAIDIDKVLAQWFPDGTPEPVQTWGPGNGGVINGPGVGNNYNWSMEQSGDVWEEVTSAYVMANIDAELGSLPVTGNIGVRFVDSKQSSTFLQNVGGDPTLGAQYITDEAGLINDQYRSVILTDDYTDVLPSLNLNFKISDTDQIRFAAAKVMGRAPINRFLASTSITASVPVATRDIDSGEIILSSPTVELFGEAQNSPYLRPFYANQFDLSYERYFDESEGAFIAAVFWKDIESFIEDLTLDPFDFAANGFDVPTEIEIPVQEEVEPGVFQVVLDDNGDPLTISVPTENRSYKTAINNAEGGYIRGIELSYLQIYDFLPGAWSGLGVSASYSFTESEITRTLTDSVFATQLPGLSENVATLTLFWEYQGFETRLSTRYRDAFVSEQVAVNEQVVNFDSETVVDFQASYDVNDNLGVLFQINNLTDEPTKSYFGEEAFTGTIQYFGTQYFFGVTYSL